MFLIEFGEDQSGVYETAAEGREKPQCGLDVWMFMSAGKLI